MNAITEIDKSGRLVVPKKLRDALHLVPGTKITFEQRGDTIVIQSQSKPRGLYLKDGILVYDAGPMPPLEDKDWVDELRNDRLQQLTDTALPG